MKIGDANFLGQRAVLSDIIALRTPRGVKSPGTITHGKTQIDLAVLYNCVQELGGVGKASIYLLQLFNIKYSRRVLS